MVVFEFISEKHHLDETSVPDQIFCGIVLLVLLFAYLWVSKQYSMDGGWEGGESNLIKTGETYVQTT